MQFILGLVVGLVIFLLIGAAFYIGYRKGQSRKPGAVQEVDEETKKRTKAMYEGFRNIMNYDVDTAMKRGMNNGQ